MSLTEILRRNAAFVKEQGSRPAPEEDPDDRILVVSTCGPAVTGLLEPALGLRRGQACVVRLASAWGGREGRDLLRSAALAVHASGCREILVVGEAGCPYSPVDRNLVRNSLQEHELEDRLQQDILEDLRGPSSPNAAVMETVRLLRHAEWKPAEVPVHGCLLDPRTGGLRIADQDRSVRHPPTIEASVPASGQDMPLPALPEIALPEIPPFDPDALVAASEAEDKPEPEKRTPKVAYGNRAGAGPVAFSDLKSMPEMADLQAGTTSRIAASVQISGTGFQKPDINVEVPQAAQIQDTGLAATPDVIARRDVQAREDTPVPDSEPPPTPRRAAQTRPRPVHRPRPPAQPVEQPQVTPVAHAPAQPPLGERVVELEPTPSAPRDRGDLEVDIQRGYVTHRGHEYPIDPELQRALLKVQRFLASELTNEQRGHIIGQVQRGQAGGRPFGELLKMMIAPVLKLGKKRYAVINELLKIKEELPRQDPDVSTAILVSVLRGR